MNGDNIKDENYDGELITFENGYEWFNDSPNGREKLHDDQVKLRDSLEESYLEYIEDKTNNPEDYL